MNKKLLNKSIELLLCIFGGYLGLHKFYKKDFKMGFIYLFTIGLFGFGWLVDIFLISMELLKSFNLQNKNEQKTPQNKNAQNKNEQRKKYYINKVVTVTDIDNNQIQIKQFNNQVPPRKAIVSNTSYDTDKKIYHRYYDCYEDWNDELKSEFTGWQTKLMSELTKDGYKECIRCTEREYRLNHPRAIITGYDFKYYYEDLK